MDPKRWERIQQVFHEALELAEDRRRVFVESSCADDPDLAIEVLALLTEDSEDSLLDQGVGVAAEAVLDDASPVPSSIGPYRVRRVLGEGGMAVVYLAEREDLDNLVAIKFLKDARLSPARRERFLHERRVLSRLSHPSISRLHDAGTLDDGTPYFVMEYVDGLPLTEFCQRHDLSLRRRLELFREVCEAVQYAHRRALIHRDLKPSNIFAFERPSGRGAAVKLLDFGIAKQIDDEAAPDLTRTGLGIMTPAFAAPEQLRGHTVGVATDVYSLGVVLYQLLTGSLPYDLSGQTPYEAAETVLTREPLRPSTRGFTFAAGRRNWADLDILCLTAMHKDAERRYPSVEALRRDVDHYLRGEPLEARPDSVSYRLSKFVRRNARAVAAVMTMLAAVVVLVGFYTIRLSAARDEAVAEAARTQRIQRFMLDLFEGGDEVAGPQEGLRVTSLIESGVREARALDGEPAIQAELYQTLGEVYHKLNDFEASEEMLLLALEQRRGLLGDDHPDVARTLISLALLRSDQEIHDDSATHAREALEIAEAKVPEEHPLYADALAAMGVVAESAGDYEEAIAYWERVVELQERRDDARGRMTALGGLADAHFYKGDYQDSDRINRQLLELVEEHLGTSHPAYATGMVNLGSSRRWLGYSDEAEKLYRDALPINEAYFGREHPTVASNLNLIGAALTDQEKYDEARVYIDEALEVRTRVFGPNHTRTARTVNQLGRAQLASGDIDAAEASFLREFEIYRTAVGPDHPWTATAMSNLASIHFRREEWDEAEEFMRRSLAIYVEALDPGHVDIAFAHTKLGRLMLQLERYQEAATELLAGYEILVAQASPSISWLEIARKELVVTYEALGNEEQAARFRAELAQNAPADD